MAGEKLQVILELVNGQYKQGAKEAATATAQIGGAAKASSGSVGLLQGAVNQARTTLKAFGGVAAAGAVLKFGADSVRAASDLQESMNAVKVVFGEATGTITDFGEKAAESAGLAQAEFQQMATVLGSALINAGIPLDQAADKTIELTQRAADMASVFNTTVPDALASMQAALRGESDPIEKYGVTLSAAAVDAEAAALGFKKVAGEWDAQAKTAARLSLIMKQTSRVQGDFANTSDGLANKTRILSARMTDLQAQIGGYLIPALASLADEGLDATNVISGLLGVIDHASAAISGNAEAASAANEEFDEYSSLLDILIPGITASLQPWSDLNALLDENATAAETAAEAHDSWVTAGHAFIPVIGDTIKLLDSQGRAFSNAAKAADTQRKAMINLANAQADLLDPLANVLRLQKEEKEARERLTAVQEDGEASTADLALAVIEAEQAFLRLQSAGAALTADQIQAFAQLLITEFGYTEAQVLDTLDAMNLLDGWSGSATFTLNMAVRNLEDAIAATGGGSGVNNTDIQVRAGGGPVKRGRPYLVGEGGAELMVPDQNGMILPHGMAIGGGAMSSNPVFDMRQRSVSFNFLPAPTGQADLQYWTLLSNHQTFGKF